jgi:hypothetical protein
VFDAFMVFITFAVSLMGQPGWFIKKVHNIALSKGLSWPVTSHSEDDNYRATAISYMISIAGDQLY